jgi:hypothetical protein
MLVAVTSVVVGCSDYMLVAVTSVVVGCSDYMLVAVTIVTAASFLCAAGICTMGES